MGSSKARAMLEDLGLREMPYGNPEVSAMAQICEILRTLPDEASRQRVMRWTFGRFNPDFKWPSDRKDAPVVAAPDPGAAADISTEIAAVAPDIVVPMKPRRRESADFGRQLSELEDLLPARRPRKATATVHPISLDALDAL